MPEPRESTTTTTSSAAADAPVAGRESASADAAPPAVAANQMDTSTPTATPSEASQASVPQPDTPTGPELFEAVPIDASNDLAGDGLPHNGDESADGAPPATAGGEVGDRISIRSATYGRNCGAPTGNVTEQVRAVCHGTECTVRVSNDVFGDPSPNCAKDFIAEWTCGETVFPASHEPIVNENYDVLLRCPP